MDIENFLQSPRAAAHSLYNLDRDATFEIIEDLEDRNSSHARTVAREMTSYILEDVEHYHVCKYPADGPLRLHVSFRVARNEHGVKRTTAYVSIVDGGREFRSSEEWECEAWCPLEAVLGLRDMVRYMDIPVSTRGELRADGF